MYRAPQPCSNKLRSCGMGWGIANITLGLGKVEIEGDVLDVLRALDASAMDLSDMGAILDGISSLMEFECLSWKHLLPIIDLFIPQLNKERHAKAVSDCRIQQLLFFVDTQLASHADLFAACFWSTTMVRYVSSYSLSFCTKHVLTFYIKYRKFSTVCRVANIWLTDLFSVWIARATSCLFTLDMHD